jgi:hypothetical protein
MLAVLPFILKAVLALGAAVAVVYVATLTLPFLLDWFRDRAARIVGDKSKLAVTARADIENGKFTYIQGIFDTNKGRFAEARRIVANGVDDEVKQAHEAHRVTVWS